MYFLDKTKKEIVKLINQILGKELVQVSFLTYPQQVEHGDLCLPCFMLAKELVKSPADIAQEIVAKIKKNKTVSGASAIGPYVNFFLDKKSLAEKVLSEIGKKQKKFGKNKIGKNKRVMIEYSNVNTHKEYHVGHLRNLCYGDSVNRILAVNGYKVIPVSYINDFGIHVAKTLWAYLEYYKNEKLPENKGLFLGQVYVRASQELEHNALAKGLVNFMMQKIEARKGSDYKLWKTTRKWSIEHFSHIYQELDIRFDKVFYESEYIDRGREMIPELIKKGILKESQGAVIADFESEGNGVLVVLRSDGTATYPVADIPLAQMKFEKFKLDSSIYVVDNRQKLYFKQLFSILKKMGFKQKMVHLEYDFVKLPSGMMSSRSGNVITYEVLKKMLLDYAASEIKKRHSDWGDEKIKPVAEVIVVGAIKFEMLKISFDQVITFDIEKALDFTGYTCAYLQYTYARIKSILRNSGSLNFEVKDIKFENNKEAQLILKLAKYPEVIVLAGEKYNPVEISKYLFELAQLFNDYYHSVNILKSEKEIKKSRLALIEKVSLVLQNGLDLLGIKTVEEM